LKYLKKCIKTVLLFSLKNLKTLKPIAVAMNPQNKYINKRISYLGSKIAVVSGFDLLPFLFNIRS